MPPSDAGLIWSNLCPTNLLALSCKRLYPLTECPSFISSLLSWQATPISQSVTLASHTLALPATLPTRVVQSISFASTPRSAPWAADKHGALPPSTLFHVYIISHTARGPNTWPTRPRPGSEATAAATGFPAWFLCIIHGRLRLPVLSEAGEGGAEPGRPRGGDKSHCRRWGLFAQCIAINAWLQLISQGAHDVASPPPPYTHTDGAEPHCTSSHDAEPHSLTHRRRTIPEQQQHASITDSKLLT